MPGPFSLIVAMVIDVEKEAEALAVARAFIANTGLDASALMWTPYAKHGAHSRVSFALRLPPCPELQGMVEAIEAVCALAVTPDAAKTSYLNSFFNADGSLFYNRIFDARTGAFTLPGITWLDVEINTNTEAQTDLARLFDQV